MVAVSTRDLVLEDRWPGTPNFNLGTPKNGFDSTLWTDASTEEYPIGTKIQVYQDFSGVTGPYTMMYSRYYCQSVNNGTPVGVESADLTLTGMAIFQHFCSSTCLSADGTSNAFTVTNLATLGAGHTDGTTTGQIAIACGTLSYRDVTTDGDNPGGYGWFWVGGVCPLDITMLSGVAHAGVDMSTAGGVAAKLPIGLEADTSVLVFDGGEITDNKCGYSFATDA